MNGTINAAVLLEAYARLMAVWHTPGAEKVANSLRTDCMMTAIAIKVALEGLGVSVDVPAKQTEQEAA